MYTHLVPDRRIRATIKPTLGERARTSTLKAIRSMSKVTESIGDRVGGYNFSPALFTFGSRRKQCPLHLVNSKSSLLGYVGSECDSKDWSPSSMGARQHKPNDSARVGTGQSRSRGHVRCQSLFIAGERRRCEPGSNSVIVTNTLTSVEGHVLRLGGVRRTRKIFVGCPATLSFWDQSPKRYTLRSETVGNRLYPIHGQIRLCCSAAEAQTQDRSRSKTGPNTAPAFSRVYLSYPLPRSERARVRVTPLMPPSSPLPRWVLCTTNVVPAQAGIQRGEANGDASYIWSCGSTDIELCKAPSMGEG